MVHSQRGWKLSDIVYGIVVPSVVALVIIGVAMVSNPSLIGVKYPLLEAIVVVGVPMLLGLIWNQWAGGASGFLLGSLYALYYSDQLYAFQGRGDISLLGNLVSAMLIGYIAGALNKRSDNYRRMLIAGVTAGSMGSLLVVLVGQFSPILGEASVGGVVLVFLPRILAGVLVPLIARAFLRHGANRKKT
jgi:multisubunit Na+/H+ antiporter MnhG subunit